MYYFLHGNSKKLFQKADDMVKALLLKKPDASLFKLNSENYTEDKIEELIGGRALFANKYIVVLSRLCEQKEVADYLMKRTEDIQQSENVFFWLETSDDEKKNKQIEKCAEKTICFDSDALKGEEKMNIFDLSNAFAQKDKKKTWILYQKALQTYSPEEIYGTLWWQVKGLLLAKKTNNAKEAGMKPFPYQKAKQFSQKFTDDEITGLAANLIQTYHQSRLNSEDLELNLEKIILWSV